MIAFRAMNTEVTLSAPGPNEAAIAARVAVTFWHAESRFTRFVRESELSCLNRAREWVRVSDELFDALVRARRYAQLTSGLFDPGIGAALVAHGYDRSFAPGELDRERAAPPPPAASVLELEIDPVRRRVRRPPHLQLDLGGMIKGATLDAAALQLNGSGAISAGGDAVLLGASDDEPWQVEIEDPLDPARTLATVELSDCAVATSAANRRAWRVGERVAHHLIDPRTGAPAETDLLQATVFAPRAELADVLAKCAFLLGSREAPPFLARFEARAALVTRERQLITVGGLEVGDGLDA